MKRFWALIGIFWIILVTALSADYFIDFEEAVKPEGYSSATVDLNGISWNMSSVLIGSASGDLTIGEKAARFRHSINDPTEMTMLEDKSNGVGEISFWYSRSSFTGDNLATAPVFVVEYSNDEGIIWHQAGEVVDLAGIDELTSYSETVNLTGEVRIRIRSSSGTHGRKFNVDNILLTDYIEDSPLPVELSSFSASSDHNGWVKLQWISESETEMLGYDVHRSYFNSLAEAEKINYVLIPAANSTVQQIYSFIDREVRENTTYYYWLRANNLDLSYSYHGPVSIFIGIDDDQPGQEPHDLKTELIGAYPNPFNPDTNITFRTAERSLVTISIYNSTGQLITRLINGKQYEPGFHSVLWKSTDNFGKPAASGIYFYRMEISGVYLKGKKMTILK
jgi:hypothetical protein